jgi:hypothetical protein
MKLFDIISGKGLVKWSLAIVLTLGPWLTIFSQDCDFTWDNPCAGQTAYFYGTGCSVPAGYQVQYLWFVNNQYQSQSSGSDFSYDIPPGTVSFTVRMDYYLNLVNNGGGISQQQGNPQPSEIIDSGSMTHVVTVGSTPAFNILGATSICEGGSLTLSTDLTTPSNGLTFTWLANSFSNLGSTPSITVNNLTSPTEFSVTVGLGGCTTTQSVTIPVYRTTLQPQLSAGNYYHKRYVNAVSYNSGSDSPAYWQSSSTGTDVSNRVTGPIKVTQEGTYYIRNNSGSCWTTSSPGVQVSLSYVPPLATVTEVKGSGYTDIIFTDTDKDHIFQFANYYWVSDNSANPQIISPYNTGASVTGSRIFTSGTYYLKGRDVGTGTWGPTLLLNETVRSGDDELNWISTTTYDGTFTDYGNGTTERIASAGKSYFDQAGKALQSQSLNLSANQVLATHAPIKDKLGREVVAALPAPINQSTFQYKPYLVQDNNQGQFDFTDFEEGQTDLGANTPGTVGWYYSENNTLETNVPKSQMPYSRQVYYPDGTSGVMLSSGVGEKLKIGSGHESFTGSFPVSDELNTYLILRKNLLPASPDHLANNAVQNVVRDENGRYAISIADKSGKTVLTARKGTAINQVLEVQNTVTAQVNDATQPNYKPQVYFYILEDQPVSITGSSSYTVEDITTGLTITVPASGSNWPAGFYRVLLTSGQIQLSYTNYYLDVACQFYDDAGRLISSLSPNGFVQVMDKTNTGTPLAAAYAAADKTTYQYNYRGWLLSMTEPDAGTTQYLYRKDGSIRYSQNAKQKANAGGQRFSYTLYDGINRPVESGEYKGTAYSFNQLAALKNTLEYDQQVSFNTSEVTDWVKTHYDDPDPNFASLTGLSTQTYSQNYVRNAVSYTENANITTWYSYNELGRVVWMAQKPKQLNRVFVVEYSYDFTGNVLAVKQSAYLNGGALSAFYHHYEYDADKRLSKAYTSPDGTNKTLHAAYSYYLHGPLKRVELAGNLQGIDFIYNIHGWLESINHPDTSKDPGQDGSPGTHANFRKDVFGLLLDYYSSEFSNLFPSVGSHDLQLKKYHRLPVEEGSNPETAVASLVNPNADFLSMENAGPVDYFRMYTAQNQLYAELVRNFSKRSQPNSSEN